MPTIQDLYTAQVLAQYPNDPASAAALGVASVDAYYLCDEASGTLVDSMDWDGDQRCDLKNFSGTGTVTYGIDGPFADGSGKAVRFTTNGSNDIRVVTDSFGSIGGSSVGIGDECIAMHAWVRFPTAPLTFLQVMKGHGGIFADFSAGSDNWFSAGTHMWTSIVTLALSHTSSFDIPINEWHYVSWQHHAGSGANYHVKDDTDNEDSGTNTSVPTGGSSDSFLLGNVGGGPVGPTNATIDFSNVFITRSCDNPILYPPPELRRFRPQIYRRQYGG